MDLRSTAADRDDDDDDDGVMSAASRIDHTQAASSALSHSMQVASASPTTTTPSPSTSTPSSIPTPRVTSIQVQPSSINTNGDESESEEEEESEKRTNKDDDEEEDEDDDNDHAPSTSPSRQRAFTPLCPLPLLFCFTLVGCTFLFASLLLLVGIHDWGVREQAVEKYNHSVEQWRTQYRSQIVHGAFGILDTLKVNQTQRNQTRLYAVETFPSVVTSASSSLSSNAASGATDSSSSDSSSSGLYDRGADLLTYFPFYYEAVIPSPVTYELNSDHYWSSLLAHDSRTLEMQSYYGVSISGNSALDNTSSTLNTFFNLTLPFLKKELKPHYTRHTCETAMSGRFDEKSGLCTYFSQLHAVCLRMKLLKRQESITKQDMKRRRLMEMRFDAGEKAEGEEKIVEEDFDVTTAVGAQWSYDRRDDLAPNGDLDSSISDASSSLPISSLTISPPLLHDISTNQTFLHHHSPDDLSGCIWDDALSEWSVGEYHPVDLREEQNPLLDPVGGGDNSANLPPSKSPSDPTDPSRQQREDIRHNQLRIAIRHTGDPLLLATSLTHGTMWFGLAKSEKIILSVVLGAVGILFLIAPALNFTQYVNSRKREERRRKRGYAGVEMQEIDEDEDEDIEEEEDNHDPDNEASNFSHNNQLDPEELDENGLMFSPSTPTSKHNKKNGFIPSEELRNSLVNGSPATASSKNSSPPDVTPVGSPLRSSNRPPRAARIRIRIDPVPRYTDPIHSPSPASRAVLPPRSVLQRREGDLPPQSILKALPRKRKTNNGYAASSAYGIQKFLMGRFSFLQLFQAMGSKGTTTSRRNHHHNGTPESRKLTDSGDQSPHDSPTAGFNQALERAAQEEQITNSLNAVVRSPPVSPFAPHQTNGHDNGTPWNSPTN